MHATPTAFVLTFFAALLPAQSRVFIGTVPTNLSLDLSSTIVALDPAGGNAFFALMPFGIGQYGFNFAIFDSVPTMNFTYGTGNWLQCIMSATHWAYLSNDACAHQPAPGTTAPQSALTSSFDHGGYYGVPGTPNLPWPGATMFTGSGWSSTVSGVYFDPFHITQEGWALFTRSYTAQVAWNACPGTSVTPNFSGWLLARFAFSFQ